MTLEEESRYDARLFFEARREEFDAQMKTLPAWFQTRYERLFGSNDPDTWEAAGFEIFIYDEALKMANLLKNPIAVKNFYDLSYTDQAKLIKNVSLSPRHSGVTYDAAVRIAYQYLLETAQAEETFEAENSATT